MSRLTSVMLSFIVCLTTANACAIEKSQLVEQTNVATSKEAPGQTPAGKKEVVAQSSPTVTQEQPSNPTPSNSVIQNSKNEATKVEQQAGNSNQTVGEFEVLEFILAGNVEAREPKNIVEIFGKDNEHGFAFARLRVNAPSEVTFIWYRNDKPVARYTSSVQVAKKWRTYSSVKLRPGQWKVQLLDKMQVVAEKSFTIE